VGQEKCTHARARTYISWPFLSSWRLSFAHWLCLHFAADGTCRCSCLALKAFGDLWCSKCGETVECRGRWFALPGRSCVFLCRLCAFELWRDYTKLEEFCDFHSQNEGFAEWLKTHAFSN
jgi:hypothetical protein